VIDLFDTMLSHANFLTVVPFSKEVWD